MGNILTKCCYNDRAHSKSPPRHPHHHQHQQHPQHQSSSQYSQQHKSFLDQPPIYPSSLSLSTSDTTTSSSVAATSLSPPPRRLQQSPPRLLPTHLPLPPSAFQDEIELVPTTTIFNLKDSNPTATNIPITTSSQIGDQTESRNRIKKDKKIKTKKSKNLEQGSTDGGALHSTASSASSYSSSFSSSSRATRPSFFKQLSRSFQSLNPHPDHLTADTSSSTDTTPNTTHPTTATNSKVAIVDSLSIHHAPSSFETSTPSSSLSALDLSSQLPPTPPSLSLSSTTAATTVTPLAQVHKKNSSKNLFRRLLNRREDKADRTLNSFSKRLQDFFPVLLTDQERNVILENELPSSQITSLSIGVDSGGMGIIHVAEWKGIKVAIKEASPHVISKEVEIYSRMKGYEGVVQFYGVTYPPGLDTKLCIVTKYAENGSLSWYLKVSFSTLTWRHKLDLAFQISASIARLHQEGIYHRDLHGGNILIDQAGKAMLTDFGASTVMEERVVKSLDEFAIRTRANTEGGLKFVSGAQGQDEEVAGEESETTKEQQQQQLQQQYTQRNDQLIGVMAYIAPERFRNPRHFDARCDIYSLGVLLWELTSGHAAFAKMPQDVQLAVSILNGKREQSVEGTPDLYRELYEQCWDPVPERRPTLEQVLETLKKVKEGMSDEELEVTRERNVAHLDSGTDFEESLSIPRPTSDYQKYLLAE